MIEEIKIQNLLSPTSINLGDYVINPYKGCLYGCLYCYVRNNKSVRKNKKKWGEYVFAKVNAAEILEKEIKVKKPKTVLLGSTTECFQPAEDKFGITRQIIEILNRNRISYNILTKSTLISKYIPQLSKGLCNRIYFTINLFDLKIKTLLEPGSPSFEERLIAINTLWDSGINVIPYICPVIPFLSDFESLVSSLFPDRIESEGLNFRSGNIEEIINSINLYFPDKAFRLKQMQINQNYYREEWNNIEEKMKKTMMQNQKRYSFYIHHAFKFFENVYE